MNVSPHQQHPTKYPWPGMASRLAVVVATVVVLVIGYFLVVNPFANDDAEADPTALRGSAAQDF